MFPMNIGVISKFENEMCENSFVAIKMQIRYESILKWRYFSFARWSKFNLPMFLELCIIT